MEDGLLVHELIRQIVKDELAKQATPVADTLLHHAVNWMGHLGGKITGIILLVIVVRTLLRVMFGWKIDFDSITPGQGLLFGLTLAGVAVAFGLM